MSQLKNDRLLRAMRREPVDMTPIWIMRQAGRYLPEYRATRQRAGSFMQLCKSPELACEVTIQPLERFDLDAAIIFSDILTIPDAMGLGLNFVEGEGPVIARPIQSAKDVGALSVPNPEQLAYVYDAISLVRKELAGKVPLIGFCGSPFTLAAYMVQGRSEKGFPALKNMLEKDPALLHTLLKVLQESVTAHLSAQIDAGAQVVMLFDTWGGMLDDQNYLNFSLAYLARIVASLKQRYNDSIPVVLFTKGGGAWLEKMAATGCDVLGLDWEVSLHDARSRVGAKLALQGNMNPACLLQSPDEIEKEAKRILAQFGKGEGHIFNLGHGITPDVPPEHVKVLVDVVHEVSKTYHNN